MSVLVVGGGGYLGSVLVRQLLEKDYNVTVFDNLTYGDSGIKYNYGHKNFSFIYGDIRDITNVSKVVNGFDTVINLAGIVGDPAVSIKPELSRDINYIASVNLANTCKYKGVKRFIFASTCSVYGVRDGKELLVETSKKIPCSLYGDTKCNSEDAIIGLKDKNFHPTIMRMGTLYGLSDRMRFDLVINVLTIKAIMEKRITILSPNLWRPFIHVVDASDMYIRCVESDYDKVSGEIFNLLSDNVTIFDAGEIVLNIINDAHMGICEDKEDKRSYRVSNDKAKKVFGFKNMFTIGDGVREIKRAVSEGMFDDYRDIKYSNVQYLNIK